MDTIVAGGSSGIKCAEDESKILWGNDVILSEIASYLSIMDLKRLSYVNKYLRDRVRTLYRFTSCASQKVTGEMEIHVFKLSRAIVEVDKLNRDTLSNIAQIIFQETEYLELQGLDKLSDSERNSRALLIVSNCQQLKSLKFETFNILKVDSMSFLGDENVRTRIANLKELQIGPTSLTNDLQLRTFVSNKNSALDGLLTLFEDITKNMKLVKFIYTEPSVAKNCFYPALLLNNSSGTLTELNLAIDFKDLESLHATKFPKLSKLKLTVIKWHQLMRDMLNAENFPELVIQFLRNHLSNLIEFHFGASYCLSLAPLFELLKQPRFNEKLEVFSLMYRKGMENTTMNWDFLQTISNLRSFDLTCPNEGFKPDDLGDFMWFLSKFPANIKSIKFRGFEFCRHQYYFQNISNIDYSVLLRFKHLTALKIHCPSFLKDHLLQYICKNLTQLTILEGDFTEVTRFGIIGVNEKENINTGISLANLENLVELGINTPRSYALKFSVEELVRSVRFSHLVKLTVKLGRFDFTREYDAGRLLKLKLISQNPCLEVINYWSIPWSIRIG